ncbi:hypothetical protein RR48_05533 [Papilio machaon]|uniref:Uncharacterized protein n=1 Tax=Papilio machaon TaxID=76193 RepID=A0A0N1IAZ6_PAPMA|nr:hypothetical protein RR48_05533 [Papilio machaon]
MSEVDLKSAERRVRGDPWVRSPSTRARRRGRLQRAAAVCEACGRSGCECARAPRCTCSPRAAAALSPRGPPVLRAHSDDEARPRRLYKSSSQKAICTSTSPAAAERAEAPDPLLETTC